MGNFQGERLPRSIRSWTQRLGIAFPPGNVPIPCATCILNTADNYNYCILVVVMAVHWFQLVVVFLIIWLTIIWWRRKPQNMPPGPRGWPIVGSLLSLSRDQPFVEMMKLGKEHKGRGGIVTLQLGTTTVVVLNTYEAIKEALVVKGDFFSSRPASPFLTEYSKRKGIVSAPYSPAWKEQRTFAMKTLRSFCMGKRSLEGKISEELSYMFDEITNLKDQQFDIHDILSRSVSNIICSIVKGDRFDYQDPIFKRLIQSLKASIEVNGSAAVFNFFPVLGYIPFFNTGLKKLKHYVEIFTDYFTPLIDRHRLELEENNIRDFIDAYLVEVEKTKKNPNSSFQDNDNLLFSISDLIVAGTETTTTTLYWLILYLVNYPDIQKEVHQEIDRVVGRDRLPTLEDEPKLPFTRAVIREVGRLATISPIPLPHSVSEDTQLMGYHIPKDTQVFINLWAVHHDPSIWEEPHSFKPSHFMDSSGNLIKPDEYIPFGIGKRQCLGEQLATMELFLFTTSLFHRYTFSTPKGTSLPSLKKERVALLSHHILIRF